MLVPYKRRKVNKTRTIFCYHFTTKEAVYQPVSDIETPVSSLESYDKKTLIDLDQEDQDWILEELSPVEIAKCRMFSL